MTPHNNYCKDEDKYKKLDPWKVLGEKFDLILPMVKLKFKNMSTAYGKSFEWPFKCCGVSNHTETNIGN